MAKDKKTLIEKVLGPKKNGERKPMATMNPPPEDAKPRYSEEVTQPGPAELAKADMLPDTESLHRNLICEKLREIRAGFINTVNDDNAFFITAAIAFIHQTDPDRPRAEGNDIDWSKVNKLKDIIAPVIDSDHHDSYIVAVQVLDDLLQGAQRVIDNWRSIAEIRQRRIDQLDNRLLLREDELLRLTDGVEKLYRSIDIS